MNKDLTIGNPNKIIWRFCLPIFGSIIFQQLYNLADSWVAGRFISEKALAAVGNSYEITLIFLAFAFGCNIGCSVITSRYFGSKDYFKMKTTINTAMLSSGLLCLLLMTISFIFSKDLLLLIQTPTNIIKNSQLYLNIYTLGLPFVFFYNIATGIFTALGDSKTPFYFLSASSISNIFADILFVKSFHMGVAGVAIATFLCQGVSAILAIIAVFIRLNKIKTQSKPKVFDLNIFKQFIIVAIPSILQQSFISFGNIIIQGVINGFGTGVIAGYSAAVKLNNLVITSFTTIGNGISNYASQNIGAKKLNRIKEGFVSGIKFIWLLCIPMTIIYLLFPNSLLTFFIKNPSAQAIKAGTYYLRIISPFYIIVSVKLISDGILRGASLMKQFMIGTFSDLILRVLLSIILSGTFLNYIGIWISWPIGWTISTIISLLFYRNGPWKNSKRTSQI